MKSVNILYMNIIFSAVNWKDVPNPAGRCMDIYIFLYFTLAAAGLEGERDAVSRKVTDVPCLPDSPDRSDLARGASG